MLGKPLNSFLYLLAGLFTRSRRLCFLKRFNILLTKVKRSHSLPSLGFPLPEDVDDQAEDDCKVGDESESHDVVPSGRGEDSGHKVFVVAIFSNTGARVELGVTVA